MSHPSKSKGYRLEKKIDQRFNDAGHHSKRVWGSDGRAIGHAKDVDNVVQLFTDRSEGIPFLVQAKSRAAIADYITPGDDVDAQIVQADRQEPIVVMRLDKFLALLDEAADFGRWASGG
ncbi:MAG: hypothetical protein LC687_07945 [Actinobacteria bacterium]|nr:hypothetical protein [Actinomycetota bacterium]